MKLLPKDIIFEESNHTYWTQEGVELLSVSKLISLYKQPFDEDGAILRRKADELGTTPELLKAEWEQIKQEACDRGTQFHSCIEDYIKTKVIKDGPDRDLVEQFSKFKFKGKLFTEVLLASKTDLIAGTTDLVELLPKNHVRIYDWKTNKKLSKFSIFKKRMKYPISYLWDCNFTHYEIQLNFYSYLLEQAGYWTDDMTIYYINPKSREIEIHPVRSFPKEIKAIIKHWKNPDTIDSMFGL